MLYLFLRRFFVGPIVKLLFRPRVTGLEYVPDTGPALLVSNHLAFMDSVFDRWGEAIVYLGIAWGGVLAGEDTVAILATAALGAAFMVSYTRAKSEGLGFSPGIGMAAIGVMPREIRLIVLSLGLIVAGATANLTILAAALAIIAVGAVITVIQRILQTRSQADSATTTTTH